MMTENKKTLKRIDKELRDADTWLTCARTEMKAAIDVHSTALLILQMAERRYGAKVLPDGTIIRKA